MLKRERFQNRYFKTKISRFRHKIAEINAVNLTIDDRVGTIVRIEKHNKTVLLYHRIRERSLILGITQ